MKRLQIITVIGLWSAAVIAGRAAIISNVLSDPGFEAITGTEPDAATSPWFTQNENQDGSYVPVSGSGATQYFHGGIEAAVFRFYFDGGAIVQNTPLQVSSANQYEFSVWALIDDPSANAAHSNASVFALSLWTSPTAGGTYTYQAGSFGNIPGTPGSWQQFTAVFDGAAGALASVQNEYIQVRIAKSNDNTTHRLYFDDASFGVVVPEPATGIMLGLFAPLTLWMAKRRSQG